MTSRLLTRKRATIADSLSEMDEQSLIAARNRAMLVGNQTVHTPSAATITPFLGIKLTARASGLFQITIGAMAAAVAADVVTWTVSTYTDTTVGTPLTLPANAAATGLNCYVDNAGTGIAPASGAAGPVVILAPFKTIGTLAADDFFYWSGIVGGALQGGAYPLGAAYGATMYVTLSITDTVAARAITQATASAFELP